MTNANNLRIVKKNFSFNVYKVEPPLTATFPAGFFFLRKLRGILIAAAFLKTEKKLGEGGAGKGGGVGGRKYYSLKTPAREVRRFGDPVRESGRLVLFLG